MTNPSNGKMVFVKVTDRGPFGRGRIIDLSWRAAKELGMLSQGVAMVLVEPVDTTIVPFKPNEDAEVHDYGFESVGIMDNLKPEWYEMKEVNRKPATGHPKKAGTAKPKATVSRQNKTNTSEKTTTKNTETNHTTSQDQAIEEINSKPNTSRSYSKRQQGK